MLRKLSPSSFGGKHNRTFTINNNTRLSTESIVFFFPKQKQYSMDIKLHVLLDYHSQSVESY